MRILAGSPLLETCLLWIVGSVRRRLQQKYENGIVTKWAEFVDHKQKALVSLGKNAEHIKRGEKLTGMMTGF